MPGKVEGEAESRPKTGAPGKRDPGRNRTEIPGTTAGEPRSASGEQDGVRPGAEREAGQTELPDMSSSSVNKQIKNEENRKSEDEGVVPQKPRPKLLKKATRFLLTDGTLEKVTGSEEGDKPPSGDKTRKHPPPLVRRQSTKASLLDPLAVTLAQAQRWQSSDPEKVFTRAQRDVDSSSPGHMTQTSSKKKDRLLLPDRFDKLTRSDSIIAKEDAKKRGQIKDKPRPLIRRRSTRLHLVKKERTETEDKAKSGNHGNPRSPASGKSSKPIFLEGSEESSVPPSPLNSSERSLESVIKARIFLNTWKKVTNENPMLEELRKEDNPDVEAENMQWVRDRHRAGLVTPGMSLRDAWRRNNKKSNKRQLTLKTVVALRHFVDLGARNEKKVSERLHRAKAMHRKSVSEEVARSKSAKLIRDLTTSPLAPVAEESVKEICKSK